MREVETLRARRHDHIVPLLSSWTHRFKESERPAASLNLLFPYSSMTLDEWLNLSNPPPVWEGIDPKELKDYIYHSMQCLCSAVAFLHKEIDGLISSHHDLKPDNILLFGKDWKIADFGRTHLMRLSSGSDTEGRSGLGSFTYQPPEYRRKHASIRYGRAFDVWSLGCIFVEFLTVAVHGWKKPQAVQEFKQLRKMNTVRPVKDLPDRPDKHDDASYHNNMTAVTGWMHKLRESDRSSRSISVIGITEAMLNTKPYDRPLSWEVYLNLDELLNPNKSTEERETETENMVQRPNLRHPKTKQNPLHRSAVNANETRVKCLLKAGWSDYPVDILKVKAQDEYDIVKMLMIAKVMKGIRWRLVSKRVLKLTKSGHKGASPMPQQRVVPVPSDFQRTLSEYDRENESPPLSYTGSSTARATDDVHLKHDEQGMTRLHHCCETPNHWKAQLILEAVSSDTLQKLLICEYSKGMLPLHYAAKSGSHSLVEVLLDSLESFKLDANTVLS